MNNLHHEAKSAFVFPSTLFRPWRQVRVQDRVRVRVPAQVPAQNQVQALDRIGNLVRVVTNRTRPVEVLGSKQTLRGAYLPWYS